MWVSFSKCMTHIDLTNERVSIRECPKESVASTPLDLNAKKFEPHKQVNKGSISNSCVWIPVSITW